MTEANRDEIQIDIHITRLLILNGVNGDYFTLYDLGKYSDIYLYKKKL